MRQLDAMWRGKCQFTLDFIRTFVGDKEERVEPYDPAVMEAIQQHYGQ